MNPLSRLIVFLLAATSIASLLGDMYRLWPMRAFTLMVFLPASIALTIYALLNRWRGDGNACRLIYIGAGAGVLASLAYDLFRLPFVFSKSWGLTSIFPALPLFKVFPMFGALILGPGVEDTLASHLVGWLYHFSNGATFGVMYAMIINGQWRQRWMIAIGFAVGLELAMLFTPYPAAFNIRVTKIFVMVTLVAHLIYGVTMGRAGIRLGKGMTKC